MMREDGAEGRRTLPPLHAMRKGAGRSRACMPSGGPASRYSLDARRSAVRRLAFVRANTNRTKLTTNSA